MQELGKGRNYVKIHDKSEKDITRISAISKFKNLSQIHVLLPRNGSDGQLK